MTGFILGKNGRLLLAGGRPLIAGGAVQSSGGNSTLSALTAFYLGNTAARFNIQPNAASGNTLADVPFLFTYTGSVPVNVKARVIDQNGVAVPGADWATLQTVTYDDTTKVMLGYLTGVRVGAQYRREIRLGTDDTTKLTDTKIFGVGPNIVLSGQSNMQGTLSTNISVSSTVPGVTPTINEGDFWKNNGTTMYFGCNGCIAPLGAGGQNNGSSSIGGGSNLSMESGGLLALSRIVGDRLAAKYGRKVGVGIVPWTVGGTSMSHFLPGGDFTSIYTNTGYTAGTIGMASPRNTSAPAIVWAGDYQIVAWHQGETGSNLTRAQRFADLKTYCQMHINNVAPYGRTADKLTFLFAMMGPYGVSPSTQVPTVPYAEVLRGAVLDLVAYGATQTPPWDVRVGWTCIDLDAGLNTADGLHMLAPQAQLSCFRLIQAINHVIDPTNVPFGGEGPKLTGAYTRSGDDITLTVAHNGGSGLAAKTPGSPITGWYANTAADATGSFTGSDLTISNVTIVDSTHIKITVTGAPTTFFVKHCGGTTNAVNSYRPDVSNLIYDNVVYPTGANSGEQYTGMPLQPTPTPIQIG
jgi:hypothetical protein